MPNTGLNLLEPRQLHKAVDALPRDSRLLVKRYFKDTTIYGSDKVLVMYRKHNKPVSPAVVDRASGVIVERGDFKAKEMVPVKLSVKRPLTIDDMSVLAFAENPLDPKTPEQRQNEIIADDVIDLNGMIDRAEELIARDLLLNNGYTLTLMDGNNVVSDKYEIRFYEGGDPTNIYTVQNAWDTDKSDPFADLYAAVEMLRAEGKDATELLVSADVAQAILNNEKVQKWLDNRRFEMGRVQPEELTPSSSLICTLNAYGTLVDIIAYVETYTEIEDGKEVSKPYLPAGTAVLLAPDAGEKAYAQVTQLEQSDNQFHTYVKDRVPKYVANADGNTRTLEMTSRPMFMPKVENNWIVLKNVVTAV